MIYTPKKKKEGNFFKANNLSDLKTAESDKKSSKSTWNPI